MKNNLLILFKIELQKFLCNFRTKGKKLHQNSIIYVGLLVGLFTIAIAALYSFLIIQPFTQYGLDSKGAISFFAGIVSMLTFISTMNQARSIYIGEDYNMLSSMPIRKKDIVASKILSLFCIELVFSTLIMIPHGVMQIILAHNIEAFLICLLLTITLPIVPLIISIFLTMLITLLTARFKYANYVFTTLYALVIIGIVVLTTFINMRNSDPQQTANTFSAIGGIMKWVNPSYYFVELSFYDNRLYLLIYVGIALISALITILFLSLGFDRLHEIVSSVSMKEKYVRKDLKLKSVKRTLFNLEFKRLGNSKIYLVNVLMGSIMTMVGTIIFTLTFVNAMNKSPLEAQAGMNFLSLPIIIAIMMAVVGLVNPSTVSINIEGKNFWLVKSLPIDLKTYLKTKIKFALVLTLPAVLIAQIFSVIFFHSNLISVIFLFVIPLSYSFMNCLLGLIFALKHPKLDWSNENEAVKSAASVVYGMLVHMGLVILFSVAVILFPILLPEYFYLGYVIVETLIIAILAIAVLYLKKNAKRLFDQI